MTKKFIFLLLISLISAVYTYAQNNYSSVKVDQLTDAQILQLMQRAENMGYNDAQLEQMVKQQGLPQAEVVKLMRRVQKLKDKSASGLKGNQKNNSKERKLQADSLDKKRRVVMDDEDMDIDSLSDNQFKLNKEPQKKSKKELFKDAFDDLKPKIFGADLFKNGKIKFEPNLRIATPPNYVIGPDDQLLIDLTGDNEAKYDLEVSPEGNINIEYIGIITVGGLTIEQAKGKIINRLKSTYAALSSGRTQLALTLGNIRSIKVIINGQVTQPGTYTLPSVASVFNALYASGGPNEKGSFRKIQVIRANKVISTVDVYDFLVNGIQTGNIRLQDQDVINVPVYDKRVQILGEVKTPGIFEAINGDTFKSMLNYAGDFTEQAYTARIKVFENTDRERRITDIDKADFATYKPKNGDVFYIEPILDRFENRVEITGAVFRPGYYELEKQGLTLKQLIAKADGLKEDAFTNRGYITRLNPDQTLNVVSFDVAKIVSGEANDIPLQREDKITINSLFDLREEYKVTIQGEVRNPGPYDYGDNMSLSDLVQMAGGFKEGATGQRAEVSRRIADSDATSLSAKTASLYILNINQDLKLVADTFKLKPFDIVSIRSSAGYVIQKQVKIEGEVLYPGTYTITEKDSRISDIIVRAGGLTPSAYALGASLKRPGPEKLKENDKNAIDNKEEVERNILNLKRLQDGGVKDTLSIGMSQKVLQSDLVGINLERILKKPKSIYDLLVEDGDVIKVPKELQTVKVTGEVLNPNGIVFMPGKGFKSYVNGAGGYTTNAKRNSVYIKYANGTAAGVRKIIFFNNYPKVRPGAEIMVPKRAERERLTAQSWIGIGTAVASLGAIIVSLLR